MPAELLIVLVVAALAYPAAARAAERRGRDWPAGRTLSWWAGLAVLAAATTGPLAAAAHHGFTAHMAIHLLLGMAAPLLLVLAAPVTLALRALPARRARSLARLLRSRPARVLTHPVTAALLDGGGLWLIYTTDLWTAHDGWIHLLITVHLVGAGYLFTASIVGVDPAPHRPGLGTRAAVLTAFLAAHGILAKYLYAHPPAGVTDAEALRGAELMYYGGDLLSLAVIVLLCREWYAGRAPAPRPRRLWRLPAGY